MVNLIWLITSATISRPGPPPSQKPWSFFSAYGVAVVMPGSLYVTNNILEGAGAAPGVNANNWRGMGYYYERDSIAAAQPFPAPPVTTESPQAAYEDVLQHAGAILPRRDAVDERVVHEVRDGTGHIIKWVKDAGGWSDFPSTTPPSAETK